MKRIDDQRYLWLLRVFSILIGLSIILNIILLYSIKEISPQTKWEAFLIESEDDNIDSIYIQRTSDLTISQNSIGYQIARAYIQQYIIERESLYTNQEKMMKLWGIDSNLYYMSSEKVYKTFIGSKEYQNGILNPNKEIIEVSINTNDIQYLSSLGYWEAIATLKINDETGLSPRSEIKKIEIKANFLKSPYEKEGKEIWKNPLGFEITEYKYIK